jgi:hypothetical protein
MAARWRLVVLVAALAAAAASEAGAEEGGWDPVIRMPGEEEPAAARGGERLDDEDDDVGTRWAVLVAGSSGYGNYRHQVSAVSEAVSLPCTFARVDCHSYRAKCNVRQFVPRGSEGASEIILEPCNCAFSLNFWVLSQMMLRICSVQHLGCFRIGSCGF